jgi:hypothetical protein
MNKTNFTIEEMDVITLSKKSAIKLNWLMAKNNFRMGFGHLGSIIIVFLFCNRRGGETK